MMCKLYWRCVAVCFKNTATHDSHTCLTCCFGLFKEACLEWHLHSQRSSPVPRSQHEEGSKGRSSPQGDEGNEGKEGIEVSGNWVIGLFQFLTSCINMHLHSEVLYMDTKWRDGMGWISKSRVGESVTLWWYLGCRISLSCRFGELLNQHFAWSHIKSENTHTCLQI